MNTQLVFFAISSFQTFQNSLEVNLPYHSWQIHVLSGSLMNIKSFWTEHQNFEMFTFHWEVSVSAEVRNPLQWKTGIKPSAAMKPIVAEGLTPCKDRRLHRTEKCGQSRGHKAWQQSEKIPTRTAPVVFQKLQLFLLSARSTEARDRWEILSGKWWQVRSGKERIVSKGTHEAPFPVCSES